VENVKKNLGIQVGIKIFWLKKYLFLGRNTLENAVLGVGVRKSYTPPDVQVQREGYGGRDLGKKVFKVLQLFSCFIV
jgi:hypothetical protein